MPTIDLKFIRTLPFFQQPSGGLMRSIGSPVAREGFKMTMRTRLLNGLLVVALGSALSGCVSYGNTHALITPLGVAGYHKFKPENAPIPPRDLPVPNVPDRVAAVNENHETDSRQD